MAGTPVLGAVPRASLRSTAWHLPLASVLAAYVYSMKPHVESWGSKERDPKL